MLFPPSVTDSPFSPRVLGGHHFRITDDPDTDDSDADDMYGYHPDEYLEADSPGALFLHLLVQEK